MSTQCRDCREGWEHCHGAVIVHVAFHAECTEPDCDGPEMISHVYKLDCEAVGCQCGSVVAIAI